MNALEFLKLVLPEEGWKAAFSKPGSYHGFTDSIENLAAAIAQEDAEGNTVYFACAAFKPGSENRTKENAIGAKSFWLDIDAGEGKPYPDAKTAAIAVCNFAATIGVPAPMLVASGGGIHAYWPLRDMVLRADWERYASGLKSLCWQHGLHADPTRTADIASILRPPGTHNYKRGAIVRVALPSEAHSLNDFQTFFDHGQEPRQALPKADPLTSSLMKTANYVEPTADEVADGCAQIGHLRETRGSVSEPIWHLAIGVLKFTKDGEEAVNRWASGGYEKEIAKKFERAAALSGPTSCEALQGMAGPDRCKGCPLFGKGFNPTMARAPKVEPQKAPESPLFASPEAEDDGPGVGDWPMPDGFRREGNSLILSSSMPGGTVIDVVVVQHGIFLTRTARSEASDDRYAYVFSRYDPKSDGYIEFTLPAKTVMGSSGMAEIASRGGAIQHPDQYMKYLRGAVPLVQEQEDEMIKYDQFGWKENDTSFLLGDRLYSPAGIQTAVGSPEVQAKALNLRPRTGSLEGWGRAASRMFAAGAESQSLALLASFAAPLMKFQSSDEGGAVLSLIGGSGVGKSTALAAAASVWGRDKGVSIKNDDTYNAKFISLGVLCNLPVVYDEVHATDPEIIKRLIITFTNGSDRARGTTDGGLVQRSNSWQTLMITGSNPSLVEMIGSLPGSDAASRRIFELVATMPVNADHRTGDEMKRQLEANAGWAGDAFIKVLMQPGMLPYCKAAMEKYTQEIWTKTGLPSEYRFWVRMMGAIAVASIIVSRLGIVDFSPSRILQWGIDQMREEAQKNMDTRLTPAQIIAAFLNEHQSDVLVVNRDYKGPHDKSMTTYRIPTRQLVMRYEVENRQILIDATRLQRWVAQKGGGNYRELVNALRVERIAKYGSFKRSLGAGTQLPSGQVPVLIIDAANSAFSGTVINLVSDNANAASS